jgi:hypothetical protein
MAEPPAAAAGPRIPVVPLLGAGVLALCACLFFGSGLLSGLSGWNPFRGGAPSAPPAASTLPATSPATPAIPPATAAPTAGALTPELQLDALRASVNQAREQELVRGNVGKDLAKKLDEAAEALAKGDSGRARQALAGFIELLDEDDGKRRVPPDLRAAWQASAEAILALLP